MNADTRHERDADDDAATAPASGFWAWSNEAYQGRGLAGHLLRLQDDAGLNVNLLLWCLWCGQAFEPIPPACIKQAHDVTRSWSAELAANLRKARRALKAPPRHVDPDLAQALKKRVKKAELQAEEIEQNLLERIASTSSKPAVSQAEAIPRGRANLLAYLAAAKPDASEGLRADITALADIALGADEDL